MTELNWTEADTFKVYEGLNHLLGIIVKWFSRVILLILMETIRGRLCYYSHFADEETEAWMN